MYLKICGLTDPTQAVATASFGADAVGVVMSPRSPRNLDAPAAQRLAAAVHEAVPGVDTVLVVNTLPAIEAAALATQLGFDVLQLHGNYSHADFTRAQQLCPRVWRATSLADAPRLAAGEFGEERLLLDGSDPGSGALWDVSRAGSLSLGSRWLLAGGLTPETVAGAVRIARPGGVDVSSGVECRRGVKSMQKITEFIDAVRSLSDEKPGSSA